MKKLNWRWDCHKHTPLGKTTRKSILPLRFCFKNPVWFVCPNEPGSSVVRSHVLPVGSPMANWSQVRGQTTYGSKYPMKNRSVRWETLPRGSLRATFRASPRWRAGEWAPGGRVCHGAWLGIARKTNMTLLPPQSRGPTILGWVRCHMSGSGGDEPRDTDLGGRGWLWGHGMSPLLGGRSRRLSVTSWIWWGLPPCTALALDPNSWIGAGHYSSLEVPKVWGAGRVWGYS